MLYVSSTDVERDLKDNLKDATTTAVKLGIKELIVGSWELDKNKEKRPSNWSSNSRNITNIESSAKAEKRQDLLVDFAMFVVREDIVHWNVH